MQFNFGIWIVTHHIPLGVEAIAIPAFSQSSSIVVANADGTHKINRIYATCGRAIAP